MTACAKGFAGRPVNWGRLITAMVTPFTPDLVIDYGAAKRVATWLVDSGSDAVVVCGTTGEVPTLTLDERTGLLEVVLDAVGDRVPVIAGTGTNSTADSIALTRRAEIVGAHGVLLVTPYYNKPPQAGLIEHFRRIAGVTRLPAMLYNVPGRTGVNMLPATVAALAETENIVAVKEASGSLDQLTETLRRVPADFLVYSGDDGLTLPSLAVGAHGIVSVASHIGGRLMKTMIEAHLAGRAAEAAAIHRQLFPLFKALFMTTSPIPVKAALAMIGIDAGPVRPPLCALTAEEASALNETLNELGLMEGQIA